MSGGKGGGSTTYVPTLSPEQNAQIAAQTKFYTGVIGPQYEQYAKGANQLYNTAAGGVTNAAQNLAGTAGQAQNVLGSTGESALRSGISGLMNVNDPAYVAQQYQAAMMPAQAQYAQNIANQQAQFGGAGQLGSAREALAEAQTAGMTQASQLQAGANLAAQLAAQKQAANQALAGFGQSGLGQALGAAGQGVTASMLPMQFLNQYGAALGLVPGSTYSPNFSGTQGYTQNQNQSNIGFKI
jgi:hypothetical protein